MVWVFGIIALVAAFALARWAIGALWVRMIYDRWDAMCAPEKKRRQSRLSD